MSEKADITIRCIDCGSDFTVTVADQIYYEQIGFTAPKRCKACRKAKKARYEMQQKTEADRIWREQEEQKIAKLLSELPYQKLSREDMKIKDPAHTLYITGNGFDIMHGVPSRYSDFRDSLGKHNDLRFYLENYLMTDSLWSDFEEALAHINGGAMLGVVDMWMDNFDAYNPDAQVADYFLAIDAATAPAQKIIDALPRRFRQWVETLKPTKKPMWADILNEDGHYLTFNYTEFLETLYGISSGHITYIHGCRKNKKQKLILGHAPEAGDGDDWPPSMSVPRYKSKRKAEMLEGALDTAARQIGCFDEETTKKTDEIIEKHRKFFDSMDSVSEIVVLGHSLSAVDYPYFCEIVNCNGNKAEWFISWYSSRDLENIKSFVDRMGIRDNQVILVK